MSSYELRRGSGVTDDEQRFSTDMGASLLGYVKVLAMQGTFDATPSAGVQETMDAMAPPSY